MAGNFERSRAVSFLRSSPGGSCPPANPPTSADGACWGGCLEHWEVLETARSARNGLQHYCTFAAAQQALAEYQRVVFRPRPPWEVLAA
eukprot:14509914-Alexandrium_andersonii.AAC.1